MKTVQLKVLSYQLEGGARGLVIEWSVQIPMTVAAVKLVPHQGIIFAEDLRLTEATSLRLRYAALQLAIQSVIVTSSVMGMRVACAPRSHFLRRMLIRAGWITMDDPALLVREPGAVFTRPLPSGHRPKQRVPVPQPVLTPETMRAVRAAAPQQRPPKKPRRKKR